MRNWLLRGDLGRHTVVIDSPGNESELSERLRIGPFKCDERGWAHVNWQRLIP